VIDRKKYHCRPKERPQCNPASPLDKSLITADLFSMEKNCVALMAGNWMAEMARSCVDHQRRCS